MGEYVDLVIENVGQLCIIAGGIDGPQRGPELGELGLVPNAAIAIHQGQIVAAGTRAEVLDVYHGEQTLDAQDRLVTPGFVDSHTHLVWAGDRADEFERRLSGVSYQEIMAEGGGINKTVR